MNAVTKILSRIKGIIPVRGTLMTPSGVETYPIAISNEIMGGPFIVDNLDELKEIPLERLLKGCKCTVNEHERGGVLVPTTTYILKKVPSLTLSTVPGSDMSEYWIIDSPVQTLEDSVEYQYAPNYLGTRPPFLSSTISRDAYNAGYASDADYVLGDTSKIIWEENYNESAHVWVRQKSSSITDWGIPVKIDAGYEEGTYVDVRFQWRETVLGEPAKPNTMVNGEYNSEPVGWDDTPNVPIGEDYTTYIQTHSLWKISAVKGVYGDLISEWSKPIKVSTDPNLVRYGLIATNTDYFNELYWRGYYSIGDRYKASRETALSEWVIELIAGESGEYTDYVFKEFPDSYEPTIADAPKTLLGYGTNGWKDGVFEAQAGYTIYVSTSRKYVNGDLKSMWTTPMRFDGKNTIRCIVTPNGNYGTTFKYSRDAGTQVVTPAEIVLVAEMYEASEKISTSKYTTHWYIGDEVSGTRVYNGIPGHPIISGQGDSILTILPEHVFNTQVFTAVTFLEGEDYIDGITIQDATDGVGYVTDIYSATGFTYKGTETKTFQARFYENGVEINSIPGLAYSWNLNGTVIGTTNSVTISDTQVTGLANLTLTIEFLGNTYIVTESLTDVADGKAWDRRYTAKEVINPLNTPDTLGNPDNWSTSATNAVWVIERQTGEPWGVPYRVKGEKGDMGGAFQKTVYRLYDPLVPPSPEWRYTKPTARGAGAMTLTPVDWLNTPPASADSNTVVYGSSATFLKTKDTGQMSETVANWEISVNGWSTPFKVTHFPPPGEGGAKGDNGLNGWSMVPALETSSDKVVMKVKDFVGGTGPKPYPADTMYIGSTGLTNNILNAVNLKGPRGVAGADGIFRASDYWVDSFTLKYHDGNSGSQVITFRKAITGIVYVHGHIQGFKTGGYWGVHGMRAFMGNKYDTFKPTTTNWYSGDIPNGISYVQHKYLIRIPGTMYNEKMTAPGNGSWRNAPYDTVKDSVYLVSAEKQNIFDSEWQIVFYMEHNRIITVNGTYFAAN